MEKVIIGDDSEKVLVNIEAASEEALDDDIYFEPSSDAEYIASALNALMAVSDIDTAILSKIDDKRIKRIKRQSLRIISYCLNNQYNELFEDNNDDSDSE
jgi:hypothetical protein